MNTYFGGELFRPWKICALLAGLAVLAAGIGTQPDWTWSTSLTMAVTTHLLAPWSADVVMRLRWRLMPLAILAGWVAVDAAWMLSIDGSEAAWSLRAVQAPASACLFIVYGLALRWKGDLRSMLKLHPSTPG